MLYLQIESPKSSVLNFLDSNSFEVIISIFQRTEKVPDMERLLYFGNYFPLKMGRSKPTILHKKRHRIFTVSSKFIYYIVIFDSDISCFSDITMS